MDRLLFGPDQDASLRDFKTYSSDDESTLKDSPVTPSSGTSLSPMVTRLSAWQEKLWLQPTISRCQTLIKREEATWDPKFFQIRPIAGITALCIVLGCIVASLAILIFSNGKTVDSWPIQPTVYLAVVAAIANSALALARQEGVTVSVLWRELPYICGFADHSSLDRCRGGTAHRVVERFGHSSGNGRSPAACYRHSCIVRR